MKVQSLARLAPAAFLWMACVGCQTTSLTPEQLRALAQQQAVAAQQQANAPAPTSFTPSFTPTQSLNTPPQQTPPAFQSPAPLPRPTVETKPSGKPSAAPQTQAPEEFQPVGNTPPAPVTVLPPQAPKTPSSPPAAAPVDPASIYGIYPGAGQSQNPLAPPPTSPAPKPALSPAPAPTVAPAPPPAPPKPVLSPWAFFQQYVKDPLAAWDATFLVDMTKTQTMIERLVDGAQSHPESYEKFKKMVAAKHDGDDVTGWFRSSWNNYLHLSLIKQGKRKLDNRVQVKTRKVRGRTYKTYLIDGKTLENWKSLAKTNASKFAKAANKAF